jgi:type III secretion protein Q
MRSEQAEQAEESAGVPDPFAVDLFAAARPGAGRQESPARAESSSASGEGSPWHASLPRVTREELRLSKALSALPPALSGEARASLARVLASFAGVEEREVEIDLAGLREAAADDLEAGDAAGRASRLFVNLRAEPDGAPVALALDATFACSIVDRVLGGDGSPPDSLRAPSPTERAVIEFLCLRVLHELNALGGEPLFTLASLSDAPARFPTPEADAVEGAPQSDGESARKSPASPRVLVANVRVALAGAVGLVRVALAGAALALLGDSANPLLAGSRRRRDAAAGRLAAWRGLTPDAPLRLRLGETRASVGDVEGLERGDIVLVERARVAREGARFAGRVLVPAGAGEGFLIEGRVAEPRDGEDAGEGARPTLAVVVARVSRGAGREATERIGMENEELRDGDAGAALEGLLLTLHVELPARRISLEELSRLRAGQVLELGCRPTDPVELVADGRRVAVGELVDVEGRLGVRVTRLVV